MTDSNLSKNRPTLNLEDIKDEEERIAELVSKIKAKGIKLAFIDGFLLYPPDRDMVSYYDLCIFLEASFKTLKTRRSTRESYVTIEGLNY